MIEKKKKKIVQSFCAHFTLLALFFLIKQKDIEPDGKIEDNNDKGKKLSNITSERLQGGGSHDMEAI